ncbi:MAG: hypothetical protein HY243_08460 [Proteobacteria bacterium]|nr:hypothetical protein [Pseudomonadota bacterium]
MAWSGATPRDGTSDALREGRDSFRAADNPPVFMPRPYASRRAPPLAPQELLFLGVVMVAWGLFVISLGKDMSWDFRNYHWYAPYAFLNSRLGFDIAVAHHATYYNPLLDVPFYWLGTHTHSWIALGVLGAAQGANIVPLYLIARSMLQSEERHFMAGVLALFCMTGGLTLSLTGTTYYDNVMSVFTLSGLALLVTQRETLSTGALSRAAAIALIAGLVTGSAVGLKLPQAPYAIGFAAALAVLPGDIKHRGTRLLAGGLGGVLGLALFAGYWWWKMDHLTGNPLFPYFNQYFHSPLALDATYRDTRFLPANLREALLYPILFSIDWRVANDLPFGDARVGLAYLTVLITLPFWIFSGRSRKPLVAPAAAAAIFAFAIATYIAWISIFAIYRYILALEMLAPIVIVAAIGLWALPRQVQLSILGVLMVVALALTRPNILERAPADDPYVQVTLPPIPHPENTMLLMTGEAPLGFVVASLPRAMPVLRIDGWMIQPKDRSKLTQIARARVAEFKGDLYVLSNEYEMERARQALTDYDLAVNWIECRDIETNLGGPYRFCPVTRGAEKIHE